VDEHRIAAMTRLLTGVPSRRDMLRGLAGAGIGLGVARVPSGAAAVKGSQKGRTMNGITMHRRIMLAGLAALLALPIAEATSLVGAKNRTRTVTRTFSNAAEIFLPEVDSDDPVSATLYPSPILVRGPKGNIRDVNLHLNGLEHPYPDDVQVLLVGPRGQIAQVMGNVGGRTDVNDVTLRLDDEAAASLPNDTALSSGTFKPTAAPAAPTFSIPRRHSHVGTRPSPSFAAATRTGRGVSSCKTRTRPRSPAASRRAGRSRSRRR
jgi:hypothetical protein